MPCSACDSYKNNNAIHLMNSYKKSNRVFKKYRTNNQLIKKRFVTKKQFVTKKRRIKFPLGNLKR